MIDQNKIKEFKKLRNYFRENDKHTFAHYAYTFLDELIKEYESNQVQAVVSVKTAEVKMFPMMQSKIYITWEVAEKIYDRYVKLYGSGQTLERIAERGGFGWSEVEEIEKRFNSRFPD